jgi:O-antigen ligase/tetratricopeptide (TPR) repeat protein
MAAAAARPEWLLLLFVLLFAPLAFGAVEPWSRAIASCAALAGLAIALRRRARGGALHLHETPGALPLSLLLGLFALQAAPLPPALVRALSPAAHARWAAALGEGALPWLPLSLDPLATLLELARFAGCAAVYLLAVQLLARRERLRALTTALAVFAAALAFAAILQRSVSPRLLLFFRETAAPHPFGPFVNRNHYANLMAMLAPVLLALYLGRAPRSAALTARGRLADLLARPESGARLLHGVAALLAGASLALSLSRGAIVAVGAALLALGLCLAAGGLARRRALAAGLLFLALALLLGRLAWSGIGERFAALRANPDVVDAVRAGLWRDTLRIAADFPLLGAGVGSFARIYPSYRTIPGSLAVDHPHNDYLEILAGGGVAGLGLFAWFVAAVLLAVARAGRRRRDPAAVTLACGAVAGCVAFLVHSASDFSLAIGANAVVFFFLLGLAVSASHTRGHGDGPETLLRWRRLPAAVAHLAVAAAFIAALFLAADIAARHCWRRAAQELSQGETAAPPPPGAHHLLRLAARLQPLEAAYPAALARAAARAGEAGEALRLTRRALRLLPLDGDCLAQLGSLQGARGDEAAARRSFAAAVVSDRVSARHAEAFGAWLLTRGDRAGGAAQLQEALAREPRRLPAIVGLMVLAGFDDREIAAAVPARLEALVGLASFFETSGAAAPAAETWRRVLTLDPGNAKAAAALRRAAGAHR